MRKILLALILLCSTFATAQTVSLAPVPKQIFFGTTGSFIDKPLAGGKIYTYASGTMTPLASYNSATGLSANPNPVILDAAGFANLWLSNTATYRFVVFDANGVQQWLVDGITAGGGGGGGAALPGVFGDIILSNGTGQAVVDSGNITGDPVTDTIFALNGFKSGSPTPTGCNGVAGGSGCTTFGLGTDTGTPTAGECILQGFSSTNTLKISCNGAAFADIGTGGGGSITGVLGQPTYATGVAAAQSVPVELAIDLFAGANSSAKTNACITALPAAGGICRFSAGSYTMPTTITVSKPNVTLRGAGMGNFGLGTAATVLNFAAGVSGIVGTTEGLHVEDLMIKSASVGVGTDDGMTFGGGSSVARRVVVKGFGNRGVVFNDNTDFWHMETVYADSNRSDGFYWSPACTDQNMGFSSNLSSTNNGGLGYNIQCGGGNYFLDSHAANNTGGAWIVNSTYNNIINPYVESGTGSSFAFASGTSYNHASFSAFGQPTTINDFGIPDTNTIYYDGWGSTDGQYPAQTSFSLTGRPQNSPGTFYSWILDTGAFCSQEMQIRDRKNSQAINYYCPSRGWNFLAPLTIGADNSIQGSLRIANGTAAAHSILESGALTTYTLTLPTGPPPVNGYALVGSTAGILTWAAGGGGGGITNSAPNNVITKSDGTNVISSSITDTGTALTTTATTLSIGSSPPTACGSATGCFAAAEASTAGTPTIGVDYLRADATTHTWRQSLNGAAESALGGIGTVTSVTSANADIGVATTTTTPVLTLNSGTGANQILKLNGSSQIPAVNGSLLTSLTPANITVGALANGMTGTTQTVGDNTTKLATDAFVIANVAVGAGTGFNNGAGTGYQDGLEIASPGNPAATYDRLYFDSTSHVLTCLKTGGGSCMPAAGSAAFNTITTGDNTGAAMGVRSGASFLVNYNSASLASPLTGTLIQLGQANSTVGRLELDSFASSSFFTANRSNGTAASPSGLSADDAFGGVNAYGHNGTSVVGPQATFRMFASQTWTTSHLGTYAAIATTPNNSTSLTEVVRFENSGGVTVPSTVPGGDKGAGTINAVGLYVNGVAVGSGGASKCDPTDPTEYCFVEEFTGGTNTSGAIVTAGASIATIGSAGTMSGISSTWPHIGIRSLNTNAAATQGQGETMTFGDAGTATDLPDLKNNTNWTMQWIFQLQETTTSVFRVGSASLINTMRPFNFIGLRYDVNSPLSSQAITSIVCTTTVCTVTNAGGTMLNPGQTMTIAGATCPTRTVNGAQVMTQLSSATAWKFAQSGAAETCGTPGTVSTSPDGNFKFVASNTDTSHATVVDTGVAADTSWHTATITSTVAGTIVLVLDGGSPLTISTDLPGSSMYMETILGVDSTVASAKSVYLDRASFYMTGLTR